MNSLSTGITQASFMPAFFMMNRSALQRLGGSHRVGKGTNQEKHAMAAVEMKGSGSLI
jgi:hypothetical protein